jgi:minor extracellular serine protease Vpr
MSVKYRFLAAAAAVALAPGGLGVFRVQAATEDQASGLWFIELNGSVDTFRARAKGSGIEFRERYAYTRIWKGLSVQSTNEAASLLGKLEGVKAVYPVLTVTHAPVEAASPELIHALAMTGADVAQSELGLTGTGVKVAVMDTGVDYHHPDLGGGFGPGYRVVTGYDFVGDRYDTRGSGGALIPHPDNDPDDCNGHGTHVAGIIGASGNPETGGARGVAPGVTFGAYRVFGCEGSTSSDIMLAAMERALEDGMDVLNMSIGSAFQTWPQYPTAVGADALVEAGMVVVASIGNSGASGVYSAGAPGVGRKVIGVASFDNSHVELATFTVSPDGSVIGYTNASGAPPAPTAESFPMARTGTATSTADACAPQALGDLGGKVALIRRGTCTFYEKARRAQLAGAVGVVLYNNNPPNVGRFNPTVAVPAPPVPADGEPVTIPVVAVSDAEGALINDRLASAPVTMTWTDDTAIFPNQTAGRASSFTSYGLNAELQLKPNVGAPGGLIRSTWPLEADGYATISGTSMSSPHVAGAAALFLEAHPGASPAAIKTALQNSADPVPFGTTSFREAVHRQGAGMVDIDDAIVATTTVTPSELSLGEGSAAQTRPLTIANNGNEAVTYTFAHLSALGTRGSTFAPVLTTNTAGVVFDPPSVAVPAGATATVNVTITPNTSSTLLDRSVYGGYIEVRDGGHTYRVPYAGFTGDYQSIQVLAPGGCALAPFPAIFKRGGETVCAAATPTAPAVKLDVAFTPQAEGTTFNVEDHTDRPVILYHRAHQSRRLEIRACDAATDACDAASGRSYLVAFSDYLTRNAANGVSFVAGGFSTYTWDGKRIFTNAAGKLHRKELPEGAYKLQIVVTKALAEEGNAAHTEVWTSPTIVIARP